METFLYQPHGLLEMHVAHYSRSKLFSLCGFNPLSLETVGSFLDVGSSGAAVERQSVRPEDQGVTLACQAAVQGSTDQ